MRVGRKKWCVISRGKLISCHRLKRRANIVQKRARDKGLPANVVKPGPDGLIALGKVGKGKRRR